MATDIAFVIGILAILGSRVPLGLKVFVVSLAIADDIGAVMVIAISLSGDQGKAQCRGNDLPPQQTVLLFLHCHHPLTETNEYMSFKCWVM